MLNDEEESVIFICYLKCADVREGHLLCGECTLIWCEKYDHGLPETSGVACITKRKETDRAKHVHIPVWAFRPKIDSLANATRGYAILHIIALGRDSRIPISFIFKLIPSIVTQLCRSFIVAIRIGLCFCLSVIRSKQYYCANVTLADTMPPYLTEHRASETRYETYFYSCVNQLAPV